MAEGQDRLVLPLGRFVLRTTVGLTVNRLRARSGTVLRGPVQYCRHCPAILPRLRSGQSHPLARSNRRATDCGRASTHQARSAASDQAARRFARAHGGSAETARGLEREPRQYCPAVSAVLHWSRGRPRAARRVCARAEDLGRLGACAPARKTSAARACAPARKTAGGSARERRVAVRGIGRESRVRNENTPASMLIPVGRAEVHVVAGGSECVLRCNQLSSCCRALRRDPLHFMEDSQPRRSPSSR